MATGTRICDLLAGAARLELPRLLVGWLCRVTRVLVPGEIRSEPGDGLGTDVRARGVRDAIRQLFLIQPSNAFKLDIFDAIPNFFGSGL